MKITLFTAKRYGLLAAIVTFVFAVSSSHAATLDFSQKLTASDSAASDWLGWSVALSGNTALLGSPGDDDNGSFTGSAYLVDKTTGNQLHKLTAPDGAAGDWFGNAVAISGNKALVGSFRDTGATTQTGSAYLFDTTNGSLLHKLTAPVQGVVDQFGISVAISGNQALIGSHNDDDNGADSGSAYLFDATTGSLLHKLIAPDGAAGDRFGASAAISDNLALVGSNRDDDNGNDSGSAYLFDTTTGSLLHKLTAPDGAADDLFGNSVALSGNLALVGSFFDDDNGTDSGSAYLFDTTTGSLLHKLTAPDGATADYFGRSVALAGELALIGSYSDDDNGLDSGSAYLFDTTTGSLLQKITAQDGTTNDLFGWSVALSSDTALIGSRNDDDNATDSGSAYVLVPEPTTGMLCLLGLLSYLPLRRA